MGHSNTKNYFSSKIKLSGHSVFYLLNLLTLHQGQIVTSSPIDIRMSTVVRIRSQVVALRQPLASWIKTSY